MGSSAGNFATCCSESVALAGQDLTETSEGYRVLIRRSKTDQEGQGPLIAIPRGYRLRQVEAVQTWLEAAEINALVFRRVPTGRAAHAAPMGLDPSPTPATVCAQAFSPASRNQGRHDGPI